MAKEYIVQDQVAYGPVKEDKTLLKKIRLKELRNKRKSFFDKKIQELENFEERNQYWKVEREDLLKRIGFLERDNYYFKNKNQELVAKVMKHAKRNKLLKESFWKRLKFVLYPGMEVL